MTLEIRIKNKDAEIHLVDTPNNRPIKIIKSSTTSLISDILSLMGDYKIEKVRRVKKPLLTF